MIEHALIEIPAAHPAFPGHFPGMPILPGVVLLDEALHAIAAARGADVPRYRIGSAKFLGVVRPGEALELTHEALDNGSIRFTVSSAGRAVATGVLLPAARI
ncbi:MAG: hypothetical protein WB440_05685 [Steroidobacteraceae bacterium]|jgi:3-hydroxymyristoyl/3-hydroxydecanoyl-(acyl carrier protein) dehydratase